MRRLERIRAFKKLLGMDLVRSHVFSNKIIRLPLSLSSLLPLNEHTISFHRKLKITERILASDLRVK
ncbi:MAG: hypothetical protein A2Z14_05785 [Chloroflexi bacterium RBG_16_48_8]|nr:MAG: hypothetical protein A2Z14_05785 [Chloroflexi bacterium RBG_16_48_8]